MNIHAITCAGALLLLPIALLGRDHSDVIVMQNGDRITGEIKGLSSGVLKVDLDYVDGAVSLNWSKVARVESPQLFIIQTQDGSVYTGGLATLGGSPDISGLTIKIDAADQADVAIERSQVVRMEETSESFLQRLSGDVNLGVVYSKGNNATQYNLGSEVQYRRERWGLEGVFSSNLASSTGSATSTHNQVDLAAYRFMRRKNYYYSTFGGFLQSSAQGIKLQTTLGVGIGRYLKNTNRVRLSVLGGAAWQSARYQPTIVPVATQQIYGAAVLTDLNIFLFKKTNLSARLLVAPALSDLGRVHTETNVSYYWKIFGDLSWNLSFYGNWDNQPPTTFAGSDYGYSSGIKWTFGYK